METIPERDYVVQVHPDNKKYAAALIIVKEYLPEDNEVLGCIITPIKKSAFKRITQPIEVKISLDDCEFIGTAKWTPYDEISSKHPRLKNDKLNVRTGPQAQGES